MSVTDLPLSVLRFQYQMARVPFQVMEEQFVARMDPQAPARLFYERWLGALDTAAGMVLGDPELKQRGAALAERSDALGRAAQLDATATPQQQQADDELKTRRDQAKQDLNHARATKQRKVTATRNAAKDRKDTAAEAGAKRTAAKQQADEVAAQRINAAEAATPEGQATSRAGEENAAKVAESDDAQATRSDAATQRAQADQVENLADAEKQKREAVRANSSDSEVGRPGSNLRPMD